MQYLFVLINFRVNRQACSDYLHTAENQGHKWSKMLQHERDQRQQLQEMVEQLARQHSHLEAAAHRHRPSKYCIHNPGDFPHFFFECGYIFY